jgi:DNA-directed RNA polymerase subunit M/transcription elongation factor TFIIS
MKMTTAALFPCCICETLLDVRETKNGKPYVICDPCGMQMFVRNRDGIGKFENLVGQAHDPDTTARLAKLEERYKKKCPKCGHEFWIEERLIRTAVFDGKPIGYACPWAGCKGIVKMEASKK